MLEFVEHLDSFLLQSPFIKKKTHFRYNEYWVTTYCHTNFLIDVVEKECSLMVDSPKYRRIIYNYYDDDYKEVIDDILEDIKEFIVGG